MTPDATVSAQDAAAILGVRLQTVYAYISRGLLRRTYRMQDGHRVSELSRDEVLDLATSRRRTQAGTLAAQFSSAVTHLDPRGDLFYRGVSALELARSSGFEQAAELLWQPALSAGGRDGGGAGAGGDGGGGDCAGWSLDAVAAAAVRRAVAALPPTATALERLQVAVIATGALDRARTDRTEPATATVAWIEPSAAQIARTGRHAVGACLQAIGASPEGTVATRLFEALAGRESRPAEIAITDAALVLLADHELAPSTLAVRVAAGTGGDPWQVVGTGLAAVGGVRHGRAGVRAENLITELFAAGVDPHRTAEGTVEGTVEGAVGGTDGAFDGHTHRDSVIAAYRSGGGLPGFGHLVYLEADPRAELLLGMLAQAYPNRWQPIEHLLLAAADDPGADPNCDLALAAFVVLAGLPAESSTTIFALARIAGWLAHAAEEYPQGLRLRPRAVYTGQDQAGTGPLGSGPT